MRRFYFVEDFGIAIPAAIILCVTGDKIPQPILDFQISAIISLMTIEKCTFSAREHKLIGVEQVGVGKTIILGNKALKKEFLDSEFSEGVEHKVVVRSHDEIVDKVVNSLDHGSHHTKIKDYINENPPWGEDEEGNIIIIYWLPTAYGENGNKKVLSFPLANLR